MLGHRGEEAEMHEMQPDPGLRIAGHVAFRCTCGVIGEQGEVSAHIAAVTREEADGILAKAWTLVCAAEERDYTAAELHGIIASNAAAFTKFTKLLEVTAAKLLDEVTASTVVPIEAKRPNKVDKHRIDHSDYVHASGDVICRVCGHIYYDHPVVVGFGWLRRACDGRLLKL